MLPAPLPTRTLEDLTWGKLVYSRWIETVKQSFKIGDKVTLRMLPNVIGHEPFTYIVEYIQELHYDAEIDPVRKIPKALGLRVLGDRFSRGSTLIWRCPDDMRQLTEEEKKYDNNTTAQTEGSGPDPELLRSAYLRE
jgi:hypothetical protein